MASSPPSTLTAPPPSVSNSEASFTQPLHPPPTKVEDASNNGESAVADKKTDPYSYLDSKEYIEKCKKYEAEYTQRLMTKYFSDKNIYGGNIFDEKVIIGSETIMSSRWPGIQSFADPVKAFEEQNNAGSTSSSEN